MAKYVPAEKIILIFSAVLCFICQGMYVTTMQVNRDFS